MADYGVNINLRVKGQSGLDRLNTKVKALTKSVDKNYEHLCENTLNNPLNNILKTLVGKSNSTADPVLTKNRFNN